MVHRHLPPTTSRCPSQFLSLSSTKHSVADSGCRCSQILLSFTHAARWPPYFQFPISEIPFHHARGAGSAARARRTEAAARSSRGGQRAQGRPAWWPVERRERSWGPSRRALRAARQEEVGAGIWALSGGVLRPVGWLVRKRSKQDGPFRRRLQTEIDRLPIFSLGRNLAIANLSVFCVR
jgi:hypothetical protein